MIAFRTLLACALALAGEAQAQLPPPPASPSAEPAKPPIPAFKSGMPVVDKSGRAIGAVESIVEEVSGAMVVVRIDGKFVSVPLAQLTLQGERAVSAVPKSQLLAQAGAPR